MGNKLTGNVKLKSIGGRNAEKEKREERIEQIEDKERRIHPRRSRHCDKAKLSENPFKREPLKEKLTHLIFHDNIVDRMALEGLMNSEMYKEHDGEFFNIPSFLRKYANEIEGMKIMLKLYSSSVSEKILVDFPEARYLTKHVKYLKMWFVGHPYKENEPCIVLHESHGNFRTKCVRKSKYRIVYPRIKIIKRKCYLIAVGKEFMLTLGPPDRSTFPSDFPDGNGERPLALGYYTRMLDTCPQIFLEWEAFLYDWYNETHGPPYTVEELLNYSRRIH